VYYQHHANERECSFRRNALEKLICSSL